jgi:hypothetical protein
VIMLIAARHDPFFHAAPEPLDSPLACRQGQPPEAVFGKGMFLPTQAFLNISQPGVVYGLPQVDVAAS